MLLDSDTSHFKNFAVSQALKVSARLPNLQTVFTVSFHSDWCKSVCVYQLTVSSPDKEYLKCSAQVAAKVNWCSLGATSWWTQSQIFSREPHSMGTIINAEDLLLLSGNRCLRDESQIMHRKNAGTEDEHLGQNYAPQVS